ncbi:3-isopropylmalate dehydratase large subunit [candidate division WOR-1 bacterium RIFOXYA12_FULL_43_27]|uniref:3-isopropylmalate dehydratase large subunit n=1 Tax=candidate division WOR-1 bacterium RIFOXYC2_FULL_46_14 TaxID=1802587 RepID=A0A1F4U554_UNCSA|nr:MAG: 3-isopropylmalate dehydratase large subunit [candidate division WOR-1 bacterium RIFOXYA12_FULL_43_27]OGC20671.1 MAG: 3-isopropylmalate dehydratase large subunit [candidate division WOR-1 bacterium RIFOXYB2_FULL_46_45]OGC31592.1 MAG: 3-isopropylmalate dehydratase large subunit [candidate division WOR-1 bacterium RIFOXYA2_FULL_46_56]OGC39997.1 MAG: 3-isopropylmalate dehydratase large subunit [candidate division WOR-1 bacterium RIFOXYC2_FULL_46_14]
MTKTISEKILSNHSGTDAHAGDIVIANLDYMMGQDGTSGVAIDSFNKMGAKKVFDSSKISIVIDHSSPSPNIGVSTIHKKIREFAKQTGVNLYDIGCGVCHQLLPEQGHVVPGDLVIGADSHTCTYGAINVFSTGIGSTDLAAAWISGKLWFKVPETLKLIYTNKLPKGVFSKDLILYTIGKLGAGGATYLALEIEGEVINEMSIDARMTISNMAIECGAKAGLMRADQKTLDWVGKHSTRKPNPIEPDKDAVYKDVVEFDLKQIEPQVAKPHTVDNVSPISEVAGTPIQMGLIGTCTNGRLEDLRVAAQILKGKKVHKDCRLIVAPASKTIFLDAIKEGIIETFIDANVAVVTPGCGPCVGTHNGVPANGENVISTANRNFKGRMGNPEAFIYLGSPATVAASVLNGKITDPRKYL